MVPGKRSSNKNSTSSGLPGEDTPLLGGPDGGGAPLSSPLKTFANVFIAIVGSGVLGLPYAFMRTGWLTSLIVLFFVSSLTYYCMMLLVHTRRRLESLDAGGAGPKITSFGDLGYTVCGSVGRFVVDVMICLSQSGFCIGYILYISNAMANIFHAKPPHMRLNLFVNLRSEILGLSPKAFYIWGCFPFQLGLNSIPTLTHLAPLSIFADVVDLGAIGIVLIKDVAVAVRESPAVAAFGSFQTVFYFLGVAMYSFEGVGMVLPLESEAKDKKRFGRTLAIAMGFISASYGAFGVLGYFAFGSDTEDIITANLGRNWVSTLVQLGLSINLFFTFPLMMNPVYEVLDRRFTGGRYCLWTRWVMVLVVSLTAMFVPNFTDFMSLVGSSICSGLGFVLPGLFHLIVFKEEMGWMARCVDLMIMGIGIFSAISGTWYSLLEIIYN